MRFFFTSDEHLGHHNIIQYCGRPFKNVDEMNDVIIENHNAVVGHHDHVLHAGDFTMRDYDYAMEFAKKLNGYHTFLHGSHDKWMPLRPHERFASWQKIAFANEDIWRFPVPTEVPVYVCHYALRVWPRSHYNSWMLFGHSHGRLPPEGKSWDIGVDNNRFFPVSWEQIQEIMAKRPDNVNLVRGDR